MSDVRLMSIRHTFRKASVSISNNNAFTNLIERVLLKYA